MTYFTGSVAAVPVANKQKYLEHVEAAWPLMRSYGATRMVETWGVDVPEGKLTDLYRAVQAQEGEAIVFAWIEWPNKEVADASWEKMQQDPAMKTLPEMPFDGKRMVWGGFELMFDSEAAK
ncbi:DUF1428 domain-containing protein [Martelella mediterranea]|uniref:Uncharacterized protein YbaA (DUF1428 family) n=1 Tax=Martelella mediterranea TaxID=293089 RepID=A0A4R3NTG7_9HYPH|nr:DUF1428 domain-containing protein [Martelella mediterranea]TCT38863.1 uncharacterized protein YbaA (DUF1428 family) [Martelella mediterranea]